MKKLFKGMLTLACCYLLASCAQIEENGTDVIPSEKKNVTLTTRLALASRANVDTKDMELFYTVYNSATGAIVEKSTANLQNLSFDGDASVTLTLQLEQEQLYDIAFWAQPKGMACYDPSNLKAIKICYNKCKANNAKRNAYYGSVFGLSAADNNVTVSLKSPFGKVEVLTTTEDVEAAATMGYDMNCMQSCMKVKGVASIFNALEGIAEGETVTAELQPGDVPTENRVIEGKEYRLLTSDYLLGFSHETAEVEVKLSRTPIEKNPLRFTAGKAWIEREREHALYNRYLTQPIEFDVTVKGWDDVNSSITL